MIYKVSLLFLIFLLFFFFFFFFQAEDGIRDADVTGVQTCALPICKTASLLTEVTNNKKLKSQLASLHSTILKVIQSNRMTGDIREFDNALNARSEERRVGKECRSRWETDHGKKKHNKREDRKRIKR